MVFSSRDMDGRDLEEFISRKNFISIKVPLSSAHPQGGCRMGTSSKDAVCDSRGRVHGHPGLYVADASLFPKSSHVNPYLTIMALADRVAEGILEEIAVD
jgi:choline dehydrogenase-like flavoprotein